MVGIGPGWEYWEPGNYLEVEESFTCMAMETDGLRVFLAQGVEGDCRGLGAPLTPHN